MKKLYLYLLCFIMLLPVSWCNTENNNTDWLEDNQSVMLPYAYAGSANSYTEDSAPDRADMAIGIDEPGSDPGWAVKRVTWANVLGLAKLEDIDILHCGGTIVDPLSAYNAITTHAVPILAIEAEWAPSGITIIDCGIKTNNSSTYSVTFQEWTSPSDGSPSTIEVVATSSSYEAEDDGTLTDADIAVGSIVYIVLPSTAGTEVLQIWLTYSVN